MHRFIRNISEYKIPMYSKNDLTVETVGGDSSELVTKPTLPYIELQDKRQYRSPMK